MPRDRPIASFLIITFAVSYGLGVPFNALASSLLDPSTLAGIYVPRIVTVIGPAVAALVVAGAGGGAIPAARLCRSLRVGVVDIPWLVAIAVLTISSAAVAFAAAGLPLQQQVELAATRAPLFLGHLFIQATVIGIGEELGWRGWLLPTLAARRTFPVATVLSGLAWTAWHLPVYLFGTAKPVPFTVLLAALTIVFSWLWNRTARRTAIVALAHGSINAPLFFLEHLMPPLRGSALAMDALAYLAAPYAAIAIALWVAGDPFCGTHGATEASESEPQA